jgi:hypothetical protein
MFNVPEGLNDNSPKKMAVTIRGSQKMDINEEIVRAWLQEQGFLVRGRLKFLVRGQRKSSGWSDIDLIGYRLSDRKCVAVDISAWMAETISLSYLNDPNTRHRLLKISKPEARKAIRDYLGFARDNQYEIWLVVSFISKRQHNQITKELSKHVDRIIEFPEIMNDLVKIIKENPTKTREEESLQTIRALVLCDLL